VAQCEEPVNRPTVSDCHLCDYWEKNFAESQHGDLSKLRKHLGRHMEQLALFALPNAEPDEDKSDEDGEVDDDLSHNLKDEEEIDLTESIHQQGKYKDAEHPDTLTSMYNVARALEDQGKYDEAEAMHRETLALSKKLFGDEHPKTLRSMYNVARALHKQEKYTEAETIYRQ
jgi:tetratricopeptide (TPR) repeat protein